MPMKQIYNIIRYIHYALTTVTVVAFLTFLVYFKTDYGQVIAISITITFLNFIVALIFFIPVIIFLMKFRTEKENSPYLTSYVIYVVSTIVSIMLMPLIQSFF